jgi:hypothetical protein
MYLVFSFLIPTKNTKSFKYMDFKYQTITRI